MSYLKKQRFEPSRIRENRTEDKSDHFAAQMDLGDFGMLAFIHPYHSSDQHYD